MHGFDYQSYFFFYLLSLMLENIFSEFNTQISSIHADVCRCTNLPQP